MNNPILAACRRSLTVVGLICLLFSSFAANTVSHAAQTSSVTITSDNNDAHDGDTITFNAWVSCDGVVASGTVSFYDNNALIDTVALQDGVAAVSETPASGSHLIEAAYSGDQNCAASRGSIDQIVGGQAGISVAAAPYPATTTQTVTITATLTSLGGGCTYSSGETVTFSDGVFNLSGLTTSSGTTVTASVSGTFSVGVHTVTASYKGNKNCSSVKATTPMTIVAGTSTATCPVDFPIFGSVLISKSQPGFDNPNGDEVVDGSGNKITLPNPNYPGPQEYSVIATKTVNGVQWYGIFVGACVPLWVPAAGVTVKQPITF